MISVQMSAANTTIHNPIIDHPTYIMSSAPKNLKTYSKKVDPAPGIGPDPLTVFNGWAERILNLVENHDVFIDGHRELVDEMVSSPVLLIEDRWI